MEGIELVLLFVVPKHKVIWLLNPHQQAPQIAIPLAVPQRRPNETQTRLQVQQTYPIQEVIC
jgi:hypothetical protein